MSTSPKIGSMSEARIAVATAKTRIATSARPAHAAYRRT
jgi:hypothetical protein